MAVPTMPRFYTRAEVEADPIKTNSNLGTYTNFVNLLDLCAIAYPSGMRGDGLPSSVTLIARAGADGLIAGDRRARARGLRRADRRDRPRAAAGGSRPSAARDRIELAVVGAHLSGLPLNGELAALGAEFVREARTTADYRLYALPEHDAGASRACCASRRARAPRSRSKSGRSTPAAFGSFVAAIPPPLGIGTLAFDDGTIAKGFLVEAEGVKGAEDVSRFGGWRACVARS